jgi:hypothetical protein
MQTQGSVDSSSLPANLSTLALSALALAYRDRPKIIEHDRDYQKLLEKHQKLWLEKNPGKNFASKEGLDYLHGSLDNEDAPTLKKDAEQAFRNNPRFKRRIERYDREKKKVYRNHDEDPSVINTRREIENHTRDRHAYLKTHEDTKTSEEMSALIKKRSWERFATEHPEKTKVYAQTNADIKKALEKQTKTIEEATPRLEPITPTPLRPIPTEHRTTISQTKRFVGRGENVEISGRRRQFRPQARRVSNFGRQGSRFAARAGMAAGRSVVGLFLSSPMGWAVVGVVLIFVIFIIVFIIVLLEGGGGGALFQKGIQTVDCPDANGNAVATNGNACAVNLAGFYSNGEGIAVTAICLDKCTNFDDSVSCDRDPDNTCDIILFPSLCASEMGFCVDYSPPNPALKRLYDCANKEINSVGVFSCNQTDAPTPTPTP